MQDRANDIFVSHASAWEIAIKVQLGKLTLKVPYEEIFPGAIRLNGFEMLPNAVAHYHRLLNLPMHHRDPFDRLIIAQAITEEMSVVSCDSNFPAYGVPLLW